MKDIVRSNSVLSVICPDLPQAISPNMLNIFSKLLRNLNGVLNKLLFTYNNFSPFYDELTQDLKKTLTVRNPIKF